LVLYACLWFAFWVLMFLLGLREYLRLGGHDLGSLAIRYGIAALATTVIAVEQLLRASRQDHLLGRPALWFARFWRWLPVEALGFVAVMAILPSAVSSLAGSSYEEDDWQDQAYNTLKFFLFYLIGGGIQFAVRTYRAWHTERLRAAENARLAKEAQLAQLTQQLQPHFMFNCLNTISSLIYSNPALADALLERLATLLRAATSASRHMEQPLGEELELLQAYADIMAERFADRVTVEWSLDDDAGSCLVPTFGLQPLLENCFRHVVEPRTVPTHIVIRTRRLASRACIEIEDDGEPRHEPPVLGVGLSNLQRRLASLYGEQALLELVARRDQGLIVRVEVPCAS
jgi:two-component system LytT family sensor kinase